MPRLLSQGIAQSVIGESVHWFNTARTAPVSSSGRTSTQMRQPGLRRRAPLRARTFRADLLYRLDVFLIEVPPLRARTSDIPLLVGLFISALTRRLGKPLQGFRAPAMARLMAYDWPGNVGELSNVVERAGILAQGSVLELEELVPGGVRCAREDRQRCVARRTRRTQGRSSRRARNDRAALAESRGRVAGPSGAAAKLRVPPSTPKHKIRVLKINKSRFKFA